MLLAIIIFISDQISKILMVDFFTKNPKPIIINDYFQLHLLFNQGISFGMFNSLKFGNVIFAVLSLAICVYLIYWCLNCNSIIEKKALNLIIGGAFGNIIDRFHFPGVVDFLSFHWKNFYWPSFNLADASVCVGVFILLIINFKAKKIYGATK